MKVEEITEDDGPPPGGVDISSSTMNTQATAEESPEEDRKPLDQAVERAPANVDSPNNQIPEKPIELGREAKQEPPSEESLPAHYPQPENRPLQDPRFTSTPRMSQGSPFILSPAMWFFRGVAAANNVEQMNGIELDEQKRRYKDDPALAKRNQLNDKGHEMESERGEEEITDLRSIKAPSGESAAVPEGVLDVPGDREEVEAEQHGQEQIMEESHEEPMITSDVTVDQVEKPLVKNIRRPPAIILHRLLFTCPVNNCSSSHDEFHELEEHLKTHSDQVTFSCDLCKKSFSTNNEEAIEHMHQRETKKECCKCGRETKTAWHLAKHINSHDLMDEKWLICGHCKRTFKDRWSLQNHLKYHTGEKQMAFHCNECAYFSYKKENYAKHLEKKHPAEEEGTPECPQCKKRFSNRSELKEHKKSHRKSTFHLCKMCEAKFSLESSLRWHMNARHAS